METDPVDDGGGHEQGQGIRDLAGVLPYAAILLLMPPIILIFTAPVQIAGIPLIVVYLFGVWALIVAGAFVVAERLRRQETATGPQVPRRRAGRG
ncbi:hypothetical protein P7L66_20155 [Tistrella mobilis]|uniref:hypothetical protein n=1 Tax=Tistrella mobilis TaxID=171437 RepID=UPI00355654BD